PHFLPIPGVEGGLTAAGLPFGKVRVETEPAQHSHHAFAHVRKKHIDQTGCKDAQAHTFPPIPASSLPGPCLIWRKGLHNFIISPPAPPVRVRRSGTKKPEGDPPAEIRHLAARKTSSSR